MPLTIFLDHCVWNWLTVAVQAIREYEQRTSFYLPDYPDDLPELWELHHDMLEAEEENFEEDGSFELDDVTKKNLMRVLSRMRFTGKAF